MGGHFVVETYAESPLWFKKAYFGYTYDAVPIKSKDKRSIIFLSKSPKYIGDIPPKIDFDILIDYVIDNSSIYPFDDNDEVEYLYPMPVIEEYLNKIENYSPSTSPRKIVSFVDGEIEEVQTKYDFLGYPIIFERKYVSVDGYEISTKLPPFGRTYQNLIAIMLEELNLKKDEKDLLEKYVGDGKPRWIKYEWGEIDWLNAPVVFVIYFGKIKETLTYPVDVLEI